MLCPLSERVIETEGGFASVRGMGGGRLSKRFCSVIIQPINLKFYFKCSFLIVLTELPNFLDNLIYKSLLNISEKIVEF